MEWSHPSAEWNFDHSKAILDLGSEIALSWDSCSPSPLLWPLCRNQHHWNASRGCLPHKTIVDFLICWTLNIFSCTQKISCSKSCIQWDANWHSYRTIMEHWFGNHITIPHSANSLQSKTLFTFSAFHNYMLSRHVWAPSQRHLYETLAQMTLCRSVLGIHTEFLVYYIISMRITLASHAVELMFMCFLLAGYGFGGSIEWVCFLFLVLVSWTTQTKQSSPRDVSVNIVVRRMCGEHDITCSMRIVSMHMRSASHVILILVPVTAGN